VGFLVTISLHVAFTTESDGERSLKIGQHLTKLWVRVGCLAFLTHGVHAVGRSQP